MNAALAALLCLIVYALGYRFYSAYLATKIFALSDDHVTPAHAQEDGVDYVPTNKWVLFGHHYASIAGLGPLLGPAIAVIWGWAPAMLWVVGGALLVGCVHDFGALVVSMRARGQSIGKVTESVIGPRAKSLFHLIIFFLVALAMGVFAKVMAALFSPATAANPVGYPQAVIPSASLMILATVIGTLVYKKGFRLVPLTVLAFVLVLGSIPLGMNEGVLAFTGLNEVGRAPSTDGWSWLLLIYAFAASVLPVWLLLQPRDFLNSLLLYLGMAAMFLGDCGYDGTGPVLDPMCGSGTFVIEAAEIAAGLMPGRSRAFAFEDFAGFDAPAWAAMKAAARPRVPAARFFGSDRDAGAVRMSKDNAERAGVGDFCTFSCHPVSDLARPEGPPGLVMVNPPYGARIGGNRNLLFGLYAALGGVLKERFGGWRVGLVTSDAGLAKATGLPFAAPGPEIPHGGIKVRLWKTGVLP